MSFNSTDYILFFVGVFVFFWPLARFDRARVVFLMLCSYAFYALWNGPLVGLILFSSLLDYVCGGLIARATRGWLRTALLWLSVIANLGLLAYFKYTNFFIDNAVSALNAAGIDATAVHLDIVLPVGISFYTFQSMSYTIDIYRGELEPVRSLPRFLLFVSFFPQLIAGPIVRAKEFLPQMDRAPALDSERLTGGLYRIIRGFAKKMLIADFIAATIVDPYFTTPEAANGLETFLALTGFHLQVYCDFSGYTDIAIGTAALFGFDLPENFRRPYAAHTPANYWSRWHLTLSRFCFDYIYRPLGGNRGSALQTHFNTVFTFAVIGFWHGPSWNFVLFGVYHSTGVLGTRLLTTLVARIRGVERKQVESELEGRFLPILATNLFVIGSLGLFRSPDLETAWLVYSKLLQWNDFTVAFSLTGLGVLAFAILSHYVPKFWEERLARAFTAAPAVVQAGLVFAVGYGLMQMTGFAQQSFVYFQF